jgi:integrase
MGRPLTGAVFEDDRDGKPKTFVLRFTAYGKRRWVTLGTAAEGWTPARAQYELDNVLADVRRGLWQPPVVVEPVAEPREVPTFLVFASEWFERQKIEGGRRGGGLTDAGAADLLWRLEKHLLPFFKSHRVDAITVEDVDRYRLGKVRERDEIERAAAAHKPLVESYTDRAGRTLTRPRRALNATSINKSLATLSAILETAVEYGWLTRNPAQGRRRRLAAVTPQRSYIDRADHITALLDGARELDNEARTRKGQRRALLAMLTFAGLRIGEALALTWGDVNIARGTITVRASKTDAGVRTVHIVGVLRDELAAYAANARHDPKALVFGTSTGAAQGATNVRKRVLAKAIENANELLAADENGQPRTEDVDLIPTNLTPHSLRRTFASILFAIGETPPYVMSQMGHTTANLTLGIYARQMNRRDGESDRLRMLVEGNQAGVEADGFGSEMAAELENTVEAQG